MINTHFAPIIYVDIFQLLIWTKFVVWTVGRWFGTKSFEKINHYFYKHQLFHIKTYLSRGVSRRELANETTRLLWLDSLWASRNKRKYSSPLAKGKGVMRSGLLMPAMVAVLLNSIQDSEKKFKKWWKLFLISRWKAKKL